METGTMGAFEEHGTLKKYTKTIIIKSCKSLVQLVKPKKN